MSFGKSATLMILGNFLAAGIGALTMLLGIRLLSPAEWASAAIMVGLGPAVGVALSLGSVTYMVRRTARETSKWVRETEYVVFLARRAVVGAAIVLLGLFISAFNFVYGWVLLLAGIRFLRAGASVLMSAERRFGRLAALNVVEKATAFLVVLGLFLSGKGLSPVGMSVAFASSFLVFTFLAVALERPSFDAAGMFREIAQPWLIWRGSGVFGIASLAGPIQQADVSVLQIVADTAQSSLLAAGSRLTGGLNVVGGALASVVLPYLSVGAHGTVRRRAIVRGVLLLALVSVAFVVVAISSSAWVPVLLGDQYREAHTVIAMYIALALIITWMQPLLAALQAWNDERLAMWIGLSQASVNLIGIAVSGAAWGAVGAACSQVIVSGACLALLLALVLRRLRRFGLGVSER